MVVTKTCRVGLSLFFAATLSSLASANDSDTPPGNDMMPSEAMMEQARESAKGLMEGVSNASRKFAEDMGWLEKSKEEALSQSNQREAAELLGVDIGDYSAITGAPEQSAMNLDAQYSITVLISWSMGEEALEETLKLAESCRRRHPELVKVQLAFRGIHREETMGEFMRRLKGFVHDMRTTPEAEEYYPTITIDYAAFREHSPHGAVPVVIGNGEVRPGFNDPCIVVEGLLEESLASTQPASEEDIKERLRREIQAVDWAQKKQQAQRRYYEGLSWYPLKAARESRVRDIDMRVEVTQDIRTPSGQLIAAKGQYLDPIGQAGFSTVILVADLRKPDELEWLKRQLGEQRGKNTMVVLAGIPTKTPDYLGQLEHELSKPVYLLQENLSSRFGLEFTPSRVEASPESPHSIRVTEYALGRGENDINQ